MDNQDGLSQTSSERPFRLQNGYIHEDEKNSDPEKSPRITSSASMPVISRWDGTSRMERVTNMTSSMSFDQAVTSSDLEVIHVKSRSHRPKKPRRMKKRSDSELDPDQLSLNSLTSVSSESSAQKKKSSDGDCSPVVFEKVPCDKSEHLKDDLTKPTFPDSTTPASENITSLSAKIETLVQDALLIKENAKSDNNHENPPAKDTLDTLDGKPEALNEAEPTIYSTSEDIFSATTQNTEREELTLKESPPKPNNLDNRLEEDTQPLENDTEIEVEPVSEELSKEHRSPSEKDKPNGIVAEAPKKENGCHDEQTDDQSTTSESDAEDIHPREVK